MNFFNDIFLNKKYNNYIFYLYGLINWLIIVISLRNQRSYQDSWILEDITIPILLFVIMFFVVVITETNSNRLALIATSFIITLRLIPGLKYIRGYGTAVDIAVHTNATHHIMMTGFPLADTPYSNVPGLHVLLSAIALVANVTAEEVIKYGIPIITGITILMTYFLYSQIDMDVALRNQIIISSALAFDPFFTELQTTSFGVIIIFIFFVWLLLRNFREKDIHLSLTISLITTVIVLNFSHAVSSFIFMQLLIIAILPLKLICRNSKIANSMIRLIILSFVIFISWWMYQAKYIFNTFVEGIGKLVFFNQAEKPTLPNRLFEISILDIFKVIWMIHGNTVILAIFSLVGIIIFWFYKRTFSQQFRETFFLFIVIESSLILIVIAQLATHFGTLEYIRLFVYAVTICPIFVGITLWQIQKQSIKIWRATLLIILILSLMQVFPYQPMMPIGTGLVKNMTYDEPILYLHTAATNYIFNMAIFAQKHTIPSETRMVADRTTKNLLGRFWMLEKFEVGSVEDPKNPLDWGNWQVLFIHRPGIAGSLGEQFEVRNKKEINRIISETDRSLVYNNGETFILMRSQVK